MGEASVAEIQLKEVDNNGQRRNMLPLTIRVAHSGLGMNLLGRSWLGRFLYLRTVVSPKVRFNIPIPKEVLSNIECRFYRSV